VAETRRDRDRKGNTRSGSECAVCGELNPTSHAAGAPHAGTGHIERQNLTMRMSMRGFTRLTKACSKQLENRAAIVALYFRYHNFGRVHQTLRVTPAMEAGLADHVWAIEEIVALL
jgi:hypothetical protein